MLNTNTRIIIYRNYKAKTDAQRNKIVNLATENYMVRVRKDFALVLDFVSETALRACIFDIETQIGRIDYTICNTPE